MFDALLAKVKAAVPRHGRRRDRVSILLPFLIISLGLGALAWRSYNLSVRMEQGATALAERYAHYTAEITALRVDAAVLGELSEAADEWQQLERRGAEPTLEALNAWTSQRSWIISAMYIPDEDPTQSVYTGETKPGSKVQLKVDREVYTANGSIHYEYDPRLLLLQVGDALRQPAIRHKEKRGLAVQHEADVAVVYRGNSGVEKLDDGFAFVAPLAAPLSDFGVRAVVQTAYVSGKGWQNQRVVSLWVSLLALVLMGVGALLALRGLRKEAETMKLRGALIANVSHELRTPLSMIRLGAETLKLAKLRDHERKDIEDQILREVLLLSHLVENVLDVARIQNRSEKALAFVPVRPRDLVRNLVTTYESWIRSKGFDCVLQLDESVGEQMWDRDAVSRAVLNLIDNAIKYSGEDNRSIEVILRQTPEHVIIEVRDHGIGIDAKDLQKIFDPYFRAQFSDTITRRGAGLGLTLVQQIVTAHGGEVQLESALGQGSTFRLMFPTALATGTPADLPTLAQPREAF
jgi:signal transduction histidine kinase